MNSSACSHSSVSVLRLLTDRLVELKLCQRRQHQRIRTGPKKVLRSEVMERSPGSEIPVLLLLFVSFVCSLSPPIARVFLPFQELQLSHSFEFYTLSEKQMDYRILYVDEDQDRMYVGCKDHLLSMDINNITHETLKIHWPASNTKIEECQMAGKDPTHGCGNFLRVIQPFNRTHLFICGSGAYSPVCAYVNRGRRPQEKVFYVSSKSESGKGRCSFNPQVNTVSAMLNQELFSGMYIDFMGTDAAIFRSVTNRNAVRTDQHNSKWLSEPVFIDAHLIPDGSDPNDAKLYFFFRERLTDNNGNTRNIHTMVARNDVGGLRSLVNKWTTFLKARMVCSVVEDDGTETHFDELESVFLLETENPKGLFLYGLFTSTSSVFKGSAVCVYNMADVLTVFNGPGTVQKVMVLPTNRSLDEDLILEELEVFKVKMSERVVVTEHGLLIRTVQLSDQGLYHCIATENGFKRTLAKIRLQVLSEALLSVIGDKRSSLWKPRALASALGPSETLVMQQYCKERQQLQSFQINPRGDLGKLKPLLENSKSRNRRNHRNHAV
ncbi:Semaphorin-3C [Bagarius yarrelli]|uniref:Semaphorin-3C n=1 Tax=Bagarius yarrelli TaxID=175774 RepID=A0A556V3B8_BAGYA|nr:Semaphorin-3C [Bagarius yarrelli]